VKELSLFSGAGGGLLASKLLGWSTIGYVEINEYCQQILAQRIKDGILDEAPIFTDIRQFIQSGAAKQYRGFVDVVTGGFPCQPFSVAGKRKGREDKRNLWPETIEIIRQVRPSFVFLENVLGLVRNPYFGTILGTLAESGYDCRWRILSCAEVGGPHRRDRVWIVAYTNYEYGKCRYEQSQSSSQWRGRFGDQDKKVTWWEIEPAVDRVVDGMAHRVDRLKALGNGQVPIVAATAWNLLTKA